MFLQRREKNIAMDKVLFVATVEIHIKSFHLNTLKWFHEQGYEVHVATNGSSQIPYTDKHYTIPIQRNPFTFKNVKAWSDLKKIMQENKYKIVHAHTPMGGVCARFACGRSRKKFGTKMIYTAHGFHFFKGAPFKNWLLYHTVEWLLSYKTDCLITINQEDYAHAKEHFHAKCTKYVHGVGLDTSKFILLSNEERNEYRQSLGLKKDDFALFFAGELNKNQDQMIRMMSELCNRIPKCKLLLAGTGKKEPDLKVLIRDLGLEDRIVLLGWRNDIPKILASIDLYITFSGREGLPMNVLEAWYAKVPIVATEIRGHVDLIEDGRNGILVPAGDLKNAANAVMRIYKEKNNWPYQTEKCNIESFLLPNVEKELAGIYVPS